MLNLMYWNLHQLPWLGLRAPPGMATSTNLIRACHAPSNWEWTTLQCKLIASALRTLYVISIQLVHYRVPYFSATLGGKNFPPTKNLPWNPFAHNLGAVNLTNTFGPNGEGAAPFYDYPLQSQNKSYRKVDRHHHILVVSVSVQCNHVQPAKVWRV